MSEATVLFRWPVRVYWEDTDAGGVVYHANYLRFMDRARSEWLRTGQVDQVKLQADTGLAFVVRAVRLDFLKPGRLDDELSVTVAVKELRPTSMLFAQEVIRRSDNKLLLSAELQVVCVDIRAMRPAAIPSGLLPIP